jgi:glucose-6-phosphate 1-dehydrogenase
MDFSYERSFDEQGHPDAYERVLVDAVRGDRTLFATNDEVLASWNVLQPVITAWESSHDDMQTYTKHGDGPTLPKSFLT